jgi:hypothetical protein
MEDSSWNATPLAIASGEKGKARDIIAAKRRTYGG